VSRVKYRRFFAQFAHRGGVIEFHEANRRGVEDGTISTADTSRTELRRHMRRVIEDDEILPVRSGRDDFAPRMILTEHDRRVGQSAVFTDALRE
jgi:hypothetical protein